MAASTEEPCLLSTSMPSAVQRAASVTTAPRWKICRKRRAVVPREGCWGRPDLRPVLWDLKPEASTKAVADLHFQVPPNAGGSSMSLGTSLHQGSCGRSAYSHGRQLNRLSTVDTLSWWATSHPVLCNPRAGSD